MTNYYKEFDVAKQRVRHAIFRKQITFELGTKILQDYGRLYDLVLEKRRIEDIVLCELCQKELDDVFVFESRDVE